MRNLERFDLSRGGMERVNLSGSRPAYTDPEVSARNGLGFPVNSTPEQAVTVREVTIRSTVYRAVDLGGKNNPLPAETHRRPRGIRVANRITREDLKSL